MNWHQNKKRLHPHTGCVNVVKKTTTNKTPNTLLSSQTTLFAYFRPFRGNPASLIQIRQESQAPGSIIFGKGTAPVGVELWLLYPLDLSSQNPQVLNEQRVAAVDVEYVVDLGVSVGDKAREHQAGACPD